MSKRALWLILRGWRAQWKHLTVRVMSARWYFGVGFTLGYAAFNLGPIQIFWDYHRWSYRFFRPKEEISDADHQT